MECDRVHCCIVTVAENGGMRVGGGLCKKKKKVETEEEGRAMEMDRTVGGKN